MVNTMTALAMEQILVAGPVLADRVSFHLAQFAQRFPGFTSGISSKL